jgi:hypothetical protein
LGDGDDMEGQHGFDCHNLHFHKIQHAQHELGGEYMMMNTAGGWIIPETALEFIEIPFPEIHFVIMQFKRLGHVSLIVFARVAFKIVHQMSPLSNGATMIKGAVMMGQYEEQSPAILHDSLPFRQRLEGIGHMLQDMRRQNKVMRAGREGQRDRIGHVLAARGVMGIKNKIIAFFQVALPVGLG